MSASSGFRAVADRIGAVAGRVAASRRARRNMRVLESLPHHILKDIGWSAADRIADPADRFAG